MRCLRQGSYDIPFSPGKKRHFSYTSEIRAVDRGAGSRELGQGTWAGNWQQQTGDRELGTGNWGQGTGGRELGQGTGGQGTGGSKLGTGNLGQGSGTGNWGQGTGTGNWQGPGGSKLGVGQGTGDRELELGTGNWGQGTGHNFASSRACFAAGAGGTMGRRWRNARCKSGTLKWAEN